MHPNFHSLYQIAHWLKFTFQSCYRVNVHKLNLCKKSEKDLPGGQANFELSPGWKKANRAEFRPLPNEDMRNDHNRKSSLRGPPYERCLPPWRPCPLYDRWGCILVQLAAIAQNRELRGNWSMSECDRVSRQSFILWWYHYNLLYWANIHPKGAVTHFDHCTVTSIAHIPHIAVQLHYFYRGNCTSRLNQLPIIPFYDARSPSTPQLKPMQMCIELLHFGMCGVARRG